MPDDAPAATIQPLEPDPPEIPATPPVLPAAEPPEPAAGEGDQLPDPAVADEPGTADDQQTPDGDGLPSGEPEETPIQTVQELQQHMEYDPEWFEGLTMQVKVDGETSVATLKEMRDSFQTQTAATKKLTDAKEKAKILNQESTTRNDAYMANFAVAAKLVERTKQVLGNKVQEAEKIRSDDPAEYAARMAEIGVQEKEIQQIETDATAAFNESVNLSRALDKEKRRAARDQEYELLIDKRPEWKDETVAKAEMKQLSEYLLEQGYSQQEIIEAIDHRAILLAWKAMERDAAKAKTTAAKKKVVKVPKVLKPGNSQAPAAAPKDDDPVSILYG